MVWERGYSPLSLRGPCGGKSIGRVLNLEHKSARAMYEKTGGRRSEPGNKLDDVNIWGYCLK